MPPRRGLLRRDEHKQRSASTTVTRVPCLPVRSVRFVLYLPPASGRDRTSQPVVVLLSRRFLFDLLVGRDPPSSDEQLAIEIRWLSDWNRDFLSTGRFLDARSIARSADARSIRLVLRAGFLLPRRRGSRVAGQRVVRSDNYDRDQAEALSLEMTASRL